MQVVLAACATAPGTSARTYPSRSRSSSTCGRPSRPSTCSPDATRPPPARAPSWCSCHGSLPRGRQCARLRARAALCAVEARPSQPDPRGVVARGATAGVVARGAASCLCQGNHACASRHPRTKIHPRGPRPHPSPNPNPYPKPNPTPTITLTRQSPTPSSRRTAAARCVSRRRMRTWPSSTPSSSPNTR